MLKQDIFYPSNNWALISTTTGDGSWPAICGSDGNVYSGTPTGDLIGFEWNSGGYYSQLFRCFFEFDTLILGANAVILSARLFLYGYQKVDTANKKPQISIYADRHASQALANAISYDDWITDGTNMFKLNQGGIAAINKTGVTVFWTKSNNDAALIPPGPGAGYIAYVDGYFNEKGGAYRPKLAVTYTTTAALQGDIHIDQLKYRHAERMAV